MARTGRRPGTSGTRDAILDAARRAFGEQGYDATSIRAVARAAGVDSALVHHYFGTKAALFAEALRFPENPARILGQVVADTPREELGATIVRTFLGVWDAADRAPVRALVRSAATHDAAAEMLRQFIEREVVGTIAAGLDGDDARLRATLAGSQLIGLAIGRYVLAVEPLAGASADELVRRVGPAVQLHLTGDHA